MTQRHLSAPQRAAPKQRVTAPHRSARLCTRLRRFCRDDTGAVTVDWVLLTAAIVGMLTVFFASFNTTFNGWIAAISL